MIILRHLSKEEGSVLPFVLGMIAVVAAVSAAVVDITAMNVERARVDALADDAALAAATQIDLRNQPNLSAGGAKRVVLAQQAARYAANRTVQEFNARDLTHRKVDKVEFVNDSVRVVVTARVRVPFVFVVRRVAGGDGTVLVRGFAAAAAYTQPFG